MRRLRLIFLPICCTTAWSTTIHVPGDAATMAAALSQSVAGDSVVVAPGVYHEHDLEMEHVLTLMGETPDDPQVVIDGDGHQILRVNEAGLGGRLQGLTFQGGLGAYGYGVVGIYNTPGLSLRNCRFLRAPGEEGPALSVNMESGVVLSGCGFVGTTSSEWCPALQNQGQATLVECVFTGHYLPNNDYAIVHHSGLLPLRMYSCVFNGNGAGRIGDALRCSSSTGLVELEDCQFSGNLLNRLVYVDDEAVATLHLSNCSILGNAVGTAVSMSGTLEDCLLADNQCANSLLAGATLELTGCVLAGNTLEANYQACLVGANSLRLTRCTLADNQCPAVLLDVNSLAVVRSLLLANTCTTMLDRTSAVTEVSCNDSYANTCDNWGGALAPFSSINGNWSANPLLRDLEEGDLRPALDSPARPQGNSCGALVGALPPVDEEAAPMCRFRSNVVAGAMPLLVDFHALDQEAADNWAWDFNMDQIPDASGADVQWNFAQRGRHDVTLVTGGNGASRTRTLEDAITVGGLVLRVPEDAASLPLALMQALPADTVDLACGEYVIDQNLTVPWGVQLRSREIGSQCARLFFQGSPWNVSDLSFASGPLGSGLRGLDLAASPSNSYEAYLAIEDGQLCLTDCVLHADIRLSINYGSAQLRNCRLDSLTTVISSYWSDLTLDRCRLRGCDTVSDGYRQTLTLQDCLLEDCSHLTTSWSSLPNNSLSLISCTLLDCGEGALIGENFHKVQLDRALLTRGRGEFFVAEATIDTLEVRNSDIWGNPDGNWTGRLSDFAQQEGNREQDPFFCDPAEGDWQLALNSPCLIDSSAGLFIGAFGPGCERSRPLAACTTDRVTGPAPLTVHYTFTGMGEIDDIDWDLDGDGDTDANGPAATWTYTAPGAYQPRLRVEGPGGWDEMQLLIRAGGRSYRVPEDAPGIGAALALCAESDTVIVGCGTWQEHDLILPMGVMLMGAEPGPCAIIDAQDQGRVLQVEGGPVDSRLRDLAFTNGNTNSGGALYLRHRDDGWARTVHVERCLFASNQATRGGAVSADWVQPLLRLDGCRFEDNIAEYGGGALERVNAQVTNTIFLRNHANQGGAIYTYSDLSVSSCEFEENSAQEGGALYCFYGPTIRNSRLAGNRAGGTGGALKVYYGSSSFYYSQIDSCLFHHNSAGQSGSALMDPSAARISHCTFFGDSTAQAGAVVALNTSGSTAPQVTYCIVAQSESGQSMSNGSFVPQISCTDLWGNQGPDWPPPLNAQLGLNGNIQANPLFCRTDSLDFGLHEDSPCLPAQSDCGWMGGVFATCPSTGVPPDPVEPLRFALHPAAPNPFNPRTLLRFDLERAGPVRLLLFNLLGQQVRVLVDEELPAGSHQRMLEGGALASGVYLLKLQAGSAERQQKILLVK